MVLLQFTYYQIFQKYPAKILEDEILEVWHKLDNKFLQPRVAIGVQFLSPKQTTSIQK